MKTIAKLLLVSMCLLPVYSCSTDDNAEVIFPDNGQKNNLSEYLEGVEGCDPALFGGDWSDINYMHSAFESLIELTNGYDPQTAPEFLISGRWGEFATYHQFTRDQGFELDKLPSYYDGEIFTGYDYHAFRFNSDGSCEANMISSFDNTEECINREVEKNSTYSWEYHAENRSFTITQYYKDQTAAREYRILGLAKQILIVEFDTIAWNRNTLENEPGVERMLFVLKN